MAEQTFPQLSFAINNGSTANTIYITTDATQNQLTFQIMTNTAATGFSPAAEVVPMSQAGGEQGSLLYLDLSNLNLSADEFSALSFSAAGWEFESFPSSQTVGMTPTSAVTLNADPGDAINVSIAGLALANPPSGSSVQLTVTYYHVTNVTSGNLGIPANFKVLLQLPPDTHDADLHQAIAVAVTQPYIVTSIADFADVANSLSLVFSPGPNPTTVKATEETAFTLTFVYAGQNPGYGALTTTANALQMSVISGTLGQNWTITPGKDQQNPSWLLQPPAGQPIIGSGVQSTVQFLIQNIETTFQPGPTVLFLSYTGVPGYQDGSYAILLEKVPHVDIQSFTVTPNPVTLTDGKAQVTLNWEAYNAGTLTLMPLYQDVTGKSSFVATITDTTTFTLQADGLQLANAGNVAFKNAEAVVYPVINSFEAAPTAIYYKDFPRDVGLIWNVNTNQRVELLSSLGTSDPNQYKGVDSVTKTLTAPQMITLVPEGQESNLLLRRSLVINAFQAKPQSQSLSAAASYVAVAPNAGFVAAVNTSANQVSFLDSIGYQAIGSAVPVGKSPQGLAFSPDGSLLYVANAGDGTVSVIEATATGSTPPYSFATVATPQVGGAPQQVAVSPDGKYIYVTVDNGTQAGSLVVLQNQGDNQFSQLTSITAGINPRGVAVSPSGAQIFVANQGDNTIGVIGLSGGVHAPVNTITNVQSQPNGLAVTADGNTLLVACSGSNTVFAISTKYAGTSPRTALTVGKTPRQIAMAPGGAYAFVTNQGDGTVSLIGIYGSAQSCKVLESAIATGSSPLGIAVSPEGGLAVVANSTGSTLTVLTLATYQEQTQPAPVGALPTNVAVSPDGSQVVAWHNATIAMQQKPSTGLYVYDRSSGTVTAQMQGTQVVDCVFAPIAKFNTAYVLQLGSSQINVINTATFQPQTPIAIPSKDGTGSRSPVDIAMSADGTLLFAVVADGNRQYSLVVYEASISDAYYKPISDVTLFTASASATYILLGIVPDGSVAFVVDSVDGELWKVSLTNSSYQVISTPAKLGNVPGAIAVMPDGSKVFVLNKGGFYNSFSVVDSATMEVQNVFLPENITAVSLNDITITPDGTRLLASDGISAGIRVIDTATFRFIQTISWTSNIRDPYGIAVLPDGSQIFTANVNSGNVGIIQQVQPGN